MAVATKIDAVTALKIDSKYTSKKLDDFLTEKWMALLIHRININLRTEQKVTSKLIG